MVSPPSTGNAAPVIKLEDGKTKIQRTMCHFFGFCITLQRHPPTSIDNLLLLGYRLRHAGFDRVQGQIQLTVMPSPPKLNRQRPRQTNNAMLRRRVRTAPLRCAKAFGGGDIHDSRIIGLAQMGQCGPNDSLLGRQ